jgi:hypothetical protein
MEQEYCMPEDYTNMAIPFRMVYEGKFNLGKSLLYIYITATILVIPVNVVLCLINIRFVVDVCPLIKNILSEATYDFKNHCAMKCLQYPFCAGYNFKKKHQKKTPNCQLTHTLDHSFHDCSTDYKGWICYHPVAPRKV